MSSFSFGFGGRADPPPLRLPAAPRRSLPNHFDNDDVSICFFNVLICVLRIVAKSSLFSAPKKRTRDDTLFDGKTGRQVVRRLQKADLKDSQCFLEVGETETVCGVRDFGHQRVREIDVLVVHQLVLPVLGVQFSLVVVGILEVTDKVMQELALH